MNGVSGPLIDRLGTRLGYALCIAWWSAAALLHSFARGAVSLGAFRFLLARRSGQLAGGGESSGRNGSPSVNARWPGHLQ